MVDFDSTILEHRGRASMVAAVIFIIGVHASMTVAANEYVAPALASSDSPAPMGVGGNAGAAGADRGMTVATSPGGRRRVGVATISPGSGSFSNPTVVVTIDMCAYENSLDESTFEVWNGTANITSQFTIAWLASNPDCYDGWHGQARATGTITLNPGDNVVGAIIYGVDFEDIDGMPVTYRLIGPDVETPPEIFVTPDGEPIGVPAGQSRLGTFWVFNPRPESRSVQVARSCSGQASCSASTTTHTIAAKDSLAVNVSFTASGAWNQSGLVRVIGTDLGNSFADTGSLRVTIAPPQETTLSSVVSPGVIRRDLCLNIAPALYAAVECGDLRLWHALPTTTVMGVARTPMLTYNSQTANPVVIVPANVTWPAGQSTAATANIKLWVNSVLVDERNWSGSYWGAAGQTRRVAARLEGSAHATGVYPYVLEVRRNVGGILMHSSTGELVVVNRSESAFGAGWSVAGVDTLLSVPGGRKLLVRGDGSASIFTTVNSTLWTAPKVDGADSLLLVGSEFHLTLPRGGRVVFNSAGAHVESRGPLDPFVANVYRTTLTYTSQRLQAISLPTPTGGPRVYEFTFGGTGGTLSQVAAPAAAGQSRLTGVSVVSGRLVSIATPGGAAPITFAYHAGTNRVYRRRNRRLVEEEYLYDAGGRIREVKHDATAAAPAVTVIRAQESRSLIEKPLSAAEAYTVVDGPRTDIADSTLYWLNGYWQPKRIRDVVGAETQIAYESATWPAIATRVTTMGGVVTRAYLKTTRPLPDSVVIVNPYGNGVNQTTRYTWHPTHPLPTQVVGPDGSILSKTYGVAGNLEWSQVGPTSATRVTFGYNALLQLASVHEPGAAGDEELSYDGLGNLRKVVSPMGRWNLVMRDAIGRDTLRVSPTTAASALDSVSLMSGGVRARLSYDAAGRHWRTVTSGPAVAGVAIGSGIFASAPAETSYVELAFDAEDNPVQVTRYVAPDSGVQWVQTGRSYDNANRLVSAEHGSWRYDIAGNAIATIRGFDTVRTRFDAAGRPTRVTVASKYFPQSTVCQTEFLVLPASRRCERFPYFGALRIEREDRVFRYDIGGNMLSADNRYARVARTYFPNGQLATDTLRIRAYDAPLNGTGGETNAAANFNLYVYGLQFGYDLAGRRAWMVRPGGGGPDRYYYQLHTGTLDSLRFYDSQRFSFGFDDRGRWTTMAGPGGVTEHRSYDDDGALIGRTIGAQYGMVSNETMTYDGRGRVTASTTTGPLAQNRLLAYSGLGYLIGSGVSFGGSGERTERFRVDALGNKYFARATTFEGADVSTRQSFEGGSEALAIDVSWNSTKCPQGVPPFPPIASTEREYDAAGALTRSVQRSFSDEQCLQEQSNRTVSRSYHAGDGKLRVHQRLVALQSENGVSVYEEYRYDALGRRVMLRARPDSGCSGLGTNVCYQVHERYAWDGDQLLEETRGHLASPSASAAMYGTVRYWHAFGIDQPIAISKDGTNIVPHASWLGVYESGTSFAGQDLRLSVAWPGQKTLAYLQTPDYRPQSWHGSLIQQSVDQSGLAYRRNRYYDPASGQFTQPDPIGLAGGMNLYGYAGGDPINFSDPFGLCKVDVRFSRLGGVGKKAYYHAYIVTTAPDNTRTYFRGGPSAGGPSSGASGQVSSGSGGSSSQSSGSNSSESSNSSNSSSPGSSPAGAGGNAGPWGAISTESGKYEPGTIDYEEGTPPSMRVVDNDDSCDGLNASLGSALSAIGAANIPYNPFSSNSNATVRQVLVNSGINVGKPIVWAPGWNTSLTP